MSEFHMNIIEFEKNYHPDTGGWDRLDGNPNQTYAHIEKEVGRSLYGFVMLTQPRVVLETGTHYGYSTCLIAQALKNIGNGGHVITLDPLVTHHLWEGTDLEPHITWLNVTSQEFSKELERRTDHCFEMLVLDSDHHYNTIMEELILFDRFLIPGGHMFFHDALFYDGVGAALEQIKYNPRFEMITLNSPRSSGKIAADEAKCFRSPGVVLARKISNGEPRLTYDQKFHNWNVGNAYQTPYIRREEPSPPSYLGYDPRKRVPPR